MCSRDALTIEKVDPCGTEKCQDDAHSASQKNDEIKWWLKCERGRTPVYTLCPYSCSAGASGGALHMTGFGVSNGAPYAVLR